MDRIWIGYRHSKRDANVLIPPEVFILRALLKEGQCSQGKLIRKYHIYPEQTSRAVTSLRNRSLIQKDEMKLTERGQQIAQQVANYLPIQKSKHGHPEWPIPTANGQVGTMIINVGGGEAEIVRHIEGNYYHIQFGFMASMLIPPREQWHARSVKGTPFIVIDDEANTK
jgi:DNA-binding MarR family transcriptional regulator